MEKVIALNKPKQIKRRQVWTADLGKGYGSEQGGIRPVVVLQNNIGNKYSPTVTIVPLTTRTKNNLPVHVSFKEEEFLAEPSIALVEQIQTIDKTKLIKLLGVTGENTMRKIEIAVQEQTGCNIFNYSEAYKKLHMIKRLRSEINTLGKRPFLVQMYNENLYEIQEECRKYKVDFSELQSKYRKEYLNKDIVVVK